MAVIVTSDQLLDEAYRLLGEQTVHNKMLAQQIAAYEAAADQDGHDDTADDDGHA